MGRMATERPQDDTRLAGETLQFMQRLWHLGHALDVASKRMARTIGVTGPQRLVLRVVGLHPEISAQRIALTLGMHPSTLTGVLARLEGRKLIERTPDAADRRRSRFRLAARRSRDRSRAQGHRRGGDQPGARARRPAQRADARDDRSAHRRDRARSLSCRRIV